MKTRMFLEGDIKSRIVLDTNSKLAEAILMALLVEISYVYWMIEIFDIMLLVSYKVQFYDAK
jgi:hypothetical protein